MALRPGNRREMSSHFMPPPRSSTFSASSSGLHLDSFLAGDSPGKEAVDGAGLLLGMVRDGADNLPGPGPGAYVVRPVEGLADDVDDDEGPE